MNTASITAVLSDIPGSQLPALPSVPAAPSFSDILATASSSLAAFALLPTATSDALGISLPPAPPALKKELSTDYAAVPIALPVPVQTALTAASDAASAVQNASQPQSASSTAASPPAQSTSPSAATTAGSSGTGASSAQTSGGVALPPIAAELGTRLALGAQALLSQPSQVLATLSHGALQTASAPALSPNAATVAHGPTTPDPAAELPKLATSATTGAAAPATASATASLETALQPGAAQTPTAAAAAGGDAALLASTADSNAGPAADPGLGTPPAPTAVPLTAADATQAAETVLPTVAASALDQVAASLSQGNKLGLSQIEIQLKPASLGAVDVKIELSHDGRVTAVISADRSDTLMQLQRGSGELQQALKDAGLQADNGSLSFSLRGDPQSGDQSGRQPGYANATVPGASADDLLAAPAAIAGANPSAHSGLLNIQV